MSRDDEPTKVPCKRCNGVIGRRCDDCHGLGAVSPDTAAKQRLYWPEKSHA